MLYIKNSLKIQDINQFSIIAKYYNPPVCFANLKIKNYTAKTFL